MRKAGLTDYADFATRVLDAGGKKPVSFEPPPPDRFRVVRMSRGVFNAMATLTHRLSPTVLSGPIPVGSRPWL